MISTDLTSPSTRTMTTINFNAADDVRTEQECAEDAAITEWTMSQLLDQLALGHGPRGLAAAYLTAAVGAAIRETSRTTPPVGCAGPPRRAGPAGRRGRHCAGSA